MQTTDTMQTASIFKQSFEVPEVKGQDATVYFAYSGLKFKLIITPVEIDSTRLALSSKPIETLNFRLIMSKTISTTLDANVEELEAHPGRIEKLILQQIFSQKMTRQILDAIQV